MLRSARSNDRSGRRLDVARVAWGVACLLAPRAVASAAGVARVDDRAVLVTRVLGARHVLQGGLSGLRPSRRMLLLGGVVDFTHAASMAVLGTVDTERRRLAWIDAGVAGSWGLASLRHRRAAPTTST